MWEGAVAVCRHALLCVEEYERAEVCMRGLVCACGVVLVH